MTEGKHSRNVSSSVLARAIPNDYITDVFTCVSVLRHTHPACLHTDTCRGWAASVPCRVPDPGSQLTPRGPSLPSELLPPVL